MFQNISRYTVRVIKAFVRNLTTGIKEDNVLCMSDVVKLYVDKWQTLGTQNLLRECSKTYRITSLSYFNSKFVCVQIVLCLFFPEGYYFVIWVLFCVFIILRRVSDVMKIQLR